jgi:predicted ATPase with chaperone activity
MGRVRAVGRTIADLRGDELLDAEHVALALNLRSEVFRRETRVA